MGNTESNTQGEKTKLVILDQDGGHDDLVALALLLSNPEKVRVIGCICTDGDCFASDAFEISGKLMCLIHNSTQIPTFPIAISSLEGVNPFPMEWRTEASKMNNLPSLNIPDNVHLWNKEKIKNEDLIGEELLADLVMNSPQKVTICVTGPLSNVARCIEKYGERFTQNVEKCIIMGGAVDVGGNVCGPTVDGSAEWNIYWDPPAAKTVVNCAPLRKVFFSLDSTNSVPVNAAVVQKFGSQNQFLLSQFVGSAWAMCARRGPSTPSEEYYAWDVITAAHAVKNTIAEIEAIALDVDDSKDKSEGRTFRRKDGVFVNTFVAKNVKVDMFYNMVLSSMRMC